MYGLMKAQSCSRHNKEEANLHRLHYCGTCKTMGRLYGQKSRFLLNNDAVFFAELLTLLSADGTVPTEWGQAYQSYSCFSLPEPTERMPLSLQIAASATLIMIEFKLADQIADSTGGTWRVVQRLFSPSFYEAAERLKGWGFPIAEMWAWYQKQAGLEAEAASRPVVCSVREMLPTVAEPTAAVTGLVFQHGAAVVGNDKAVQQAMYGLGFAFGQLVYALDAYEDYEKDVRKGEFNAFQAAFGLTDGVMPDDCREVSLSLLQERRLQVEAALHALPIPEAQTGKFVARLRRNLSERVGRAAAHVCTVTAPAEALTFRERWTSAASLTRSLAAKHRVENPGLRSRLSLPFAAVGAMATVMIFPRQAQTATSLRECRDIAFNLMFVGAALQSLLFRPAHLMPAVAGAPGHRDLVKTMNRGASRSRSGTSNTTVVEVRRRRGPGCCDGFCEGWCAGCTCNCCESCGQVACCEGMECCGAGCAEGCCCACCSSSS